MYLFCFSYCLGSNYFIIMNSAPPYFIFYFVTVEVHVNVHVNVSLTEKCL